MQSSIRELNVTVSPSFDAVGHAWYIQAWSGDYLPVNTEVQTYLIVEISYLAKSRTSSPELGESAQLTTQG